jgi:hypothetical protein
MNKLFSIFLTIFWIIYSARWKTVIDFLAFVLISFGLGYYVTQSFFFANHMKAGIRLENQKG